MKSTVNKVDPLMQTIVYGSAEFVRQITLEMN